MKFRVEQQTAATRVMISGEICEETDFQPILEIPGPLVLDLAGVSRINSCGVREWLNFVVHLRQGGRELILERCAPVIVTQLNTIYNFTGGGQVRSVFGPYYCPACDREENHLIDLTASETVPDHIPCPGCHAGMEFEDLQDQYLAFQVGGR
jgi:anti-anti-sigma regulatory factor